MIARRRSRSSATQGLRAAPFALTVGLFAGSALGVVSLGGAQAPEEIPLPPVSPFAQPASPATTPAPASPPTTPPSPGAPSVVQLIDVGAAPRAALRYNVAPGTQEVMLVTTSAHTTTSMGMLGSQAMQVPTTRVTVDVGPVGDAGASRLLVPFRFTAVDALSTPGVSPALAASTANDLRALVGLEGFQLIDRQGVGTGVDIVIPATTPPALREQIQQLRRSLRDMMAPFPAEPVGLGAVWEVRSQVSFQGVVADQVTTYRLTSREGEEVELDMQIRQTARNQPLPSPQPGVDAHLNTLRTTGSGTLHLKLGHLTPASHWQTQSILDASVTAMGMQQPMRMQLDVEVWLGLPGT